MRRLDPCLAPAGYSPRRYETLSPAPVLGMGERMTDLLDIQALFANGEQGGYWPADPAYAFEDSYGNVPVSIDAVAGLRLDVSQNLELGPELNPDVGFNNPGGWVIPQASWSIANGVASNNGSNGSLANLYRETLVSFLNKLFLLEWDVLSLSVSGIYITLGGYNSYPCYATGHFVKRVGVTTVGSNARIYASAQIGSIVTVDNISLKQILGNHAFQPTTANKPYLRTTPITGKYWYDSNTSTGELTATFSGSLGSACTIVSVTPEGISILENQTVGSTYNICPPFGYNADVLIINRALTAAEKALVTRILKRNAPYYPSIVDARLQMRGYAPNNENTVDTSIITNFAYAWFGCSGLTSFPLINTAAGTDFSTAWAHCSSLTSFPLINTAAGTTFACAWFGCSGLTSFPLINTAAGTIFAYAWYGCSGLTSFPLINTAAGTTFAYAWYGCSGLTSFPANFFDSWMGVPIANCFSSTWDSCIKLTLASVQNIVVSLVVSGKSAPATGTDISLDGAPTLVAIQADTTVMTAVATLKSRNWTPKYKGTAL